MILARVVKIYCKNLKLGYWFKKMWLRERKSLLTNYTNHIFGKKKKPLTFVILEKGLD